jgi:hypothetical protein
MTRTIFLITSIAITALAVAAPSALGKGRDPGSSAQADAVKYFYAYERAALTFTPVVHDHGDATQAKIQAKVLLASPPMEVIRDHGDATQAKLTQQSASVRARERVQRIETQSNLPVVRDHGDATEAKLVAQSRDIVSRVTESSSGSGFDWPQLGIGFGLGILLAVGLWFGMRMTKVRQLAH